MQLPFAPAIAGAVCAAVAVSASPHLGLLFAAVVAASALLFHMLSTSDVRQAQARAQLLAGGFREGIYEADPHEPR